MSEFLTSCKFYFEADGVAEKLILEVSGLSVESPVAGEGGVHGSGKRGVKIRQATPTTEKFTNVTVKVVATTDKDLYIWYRDCNTNDGGASSWMSNRKAASVTAYDQAGSMQARWEIINAYPCKYEGPSFSAGDSNMANETLELVHEGIKRMQ
ncbi:phage tail protein [Thermocoleostomius sinensis]|jgi:phage tail-like protein|uniref:Phage tail protein n=1 Tax=Thermocoleostomius sinensis A174 TaxID=2016057 RepID=A0A9E8ZBH5_9CYAN|nr:phage tail protein [Thermocoleostomius sinensis]WAL60088.1 phage tail protein [Thermocoleostomius sinensis A174]